MKKSFQLFFLIFFCCSCANLSWAESYTPQSQTYHDAYVYFLKKARAATDPLKILRYGKLARLYAASSSEIDAAEALLKQQNTPVSPVTSAVIVEQPAAKTTISSGIKAPLTVESQPVRLKDISDKQTIEIPFGHSIIIERQGVKRFLVIDEGIVEVKLIEHAQVKITAVKRGSTFVHIWDESGRTTIYIKTNFLQQPSETQQNLAPVLVEHNQPFKFTYSSDWSAYYQGTKLPHLRRQNLSFLQNLSMDGPTPYGEVDSYVTFKGFDNHRDIQSYTLGVSRIPVKGTDNLNLRLFDAARHLSPLTLAGAHLRGLFADVDVLDKSLRFSYSHGQVRPAFGFLGFGTSNKIHSYVDAAKVTLLPHMKNGQYSINVATGYGADRDPSASKRAYSIEAEQKVDKVTLNGELARNDDKRSAVTSGLRYDNNGFSTKLNMRDINKDYATVLNPASAQGEIGAAWSTNIYNEKFDAQTLIDVYRNRLYFNPNDPEALNIDSSGHLHMPINSKMSSDAGLFYTHTPGELSPRMNFGIDDRLSISIDTWNKRHGTIYLGGAYQRSRYSNSPASAFDRLTAIVGASMPLTERLSIHSKYEFSWVDEPFTGNGYNPAVFNAGLNYYHQLTTRLRGTWDMNYRREQGVGGSNSFLAGEDSLDGSMGLSYSPATDVNIFADSRLRRVWPKSTDIAAYYALDVRFGLRMMFGGKVYFDPQGTVRGSVFDDVNMNGVREQGEAGLPHVKVKVGDKEVTTDEKGYFRKPYRAKAVVVSPQADSIPAGYVLSTKESLRVPIVLGSDSEVNFGYSSHSSVYGIVYVDKNANGQPDMGDQFISKVKVTLDGQDQYTDNNGAYYFRNVAVGRHHVALDLNTVSIEFVPVKKVKDDFEVGRGASYVMHFPMRIKEQQ